MANPSEQEPAADDLKMFIKDIREYLENDKSDIITDSYINNVMDDKYKAVKQDKALYEPKMKLKEIEEQRKLYLAAIHYRKLATKIFKEIESLIKKKEKLEAELKSSNEMPDVLKNIPGEKELAEETMTKIQAIEKKLNTFKNSLKPYGPRSYYMLFIKPTQDIKAHLENGYAAKTGVPLYLEKFKNACSSMLKFFASISAAFKNIVDKSSLDTKITNICEEAKKIGDSVSDSLPQNPRYSNLKESMIIDNKKPQENMENQKHIKDGIKQSKAGLDSKKSDSEELDLYSENLENSENLEDSKTFHPKNQ